MWWWMNLTQMPSQGTHIMRIFSRLLRLQLLSMVPQSSSLNGSNKDVFRSPRGLNS